MKTPSKKPTAPLLVALLRPVGPNLRWFRGRPVGLPPMATMQFYLLRELVKNTAGAVALLIAALLGQPCVVAGEGGGTIDLAGQWLVRLDSKGEGIRGGWFNEYKGEPVRLPGSLGDSGFGERDKTSGDARNTHDWTHLYTFRGLAWYQKEVTIPADWAGKRIVLFLERAHWFTQVWVDGTAVGPRQTSLSAPQTHIMTGRLRSARRLIGRRISGPFDCVFRHA